MKQHQYHHLNAGRLLRVGSSKLSPLGSPLATPPSWAPLSSWSEAHARFTCFFVGVSNKRNITEITAI